MNDTLKMDGERFLPWMDDAVINYEHLHRYRFAKEFVKDKKVLDLACGVGYGSFMLAENACGVIGIDIDEVAIRHAVSRYACIKENLKFIKGSVTNVPLEDKQIFDVIVCFESLEHINEHDKLMKETKRLLKETGIFIVSTPNKLHSDLSNYKNPFHFKELYLDEFRDLLSHNFKQVFLYGQKAYPSSNIFSFHKGSTVSKNFAIEKGNKEFRFLPIEERIDRYLIGIASDADLDINKLIGSSCLIDISETLLYQMDNQIKQKDEQIKALLNSWSWKITTPLRWLHAQVMAWKSPK